MKAEAEAHFCSRTGKRLGPQEGLAGAGGQCLQLAAMALRRNHQVTVMKGEVGRTLPEDLVEKIIAMMPYPSIFKARLLSRSWYDRFQPISLLHTENLKRRAKSFHRQVTERSHNWDTFCPIYKNEEDPIVFNQSTRKWQRLPSLDCLSFLPEKIFCVKLHLREYFSMSVNIHLDGAFLYATYHNEDALQELHVANILTKEWKRLPGRPEEDSTIMTCMQPVIDPSSDAYKLIIVCQEHGWFEHHFVQIYDSKAGTWSSNEFVYPHDILGYAHLNGVFYMVAMNKWHCLLAFNVKERTFEELRLSFTDGKEIDHIKLVVCNGDLVLIMYEQVSRCVLALKVDLVTLELQEVARCPATYLLETINARDSDINCIFFEMPSADCRIQLEYNQLKDEWKFFSAPMHGIHWSECSFQPGVNPFMAV